MFNMSLLCCFFISFTVSSISTSVLNTRLILSDLFNIYSLYFILFYCCAPLTNSFVIALQFRFMLFLSLSAFVAYLGFIHLLVAHSHPVMLMFCHLLINRNKDRGLEESQPQTQSPQDESSKETGNSKGKR